MTYSIEGQFYPIQEEEHSRACKELNFTQLKVLYHLRILNPFSDRFTKIDSQEVAERLGLTKRTVSTTLKVLDRLGWIDLELLVTRFRPRTDRGDRSNQPVPESTNVKNTATYDESPMLHEESPMSHQMQWPRHKRRDHDINDVATTQTTRPQHEVQWPRHNEQPEPLSDKGSGSPKTIKTIKTIKTLSLPEKEREKFLEFARKKASELPKPPTLPEKWIDKNHDELWAKYQELEQRKETNDQQRMQSIDKPQKTVVDPRIAADLQTGKILEISYHDKMFRDTDGWWQKWHEYEEWNAKRSANQPTNEDLLVKQLIAKAADIPI